MQITKFSRRLL